jgi:hypothetical protein
MALRAIFLEYLIAIGQILRFAKLQEYATEIKNMLIDTKRWSKGLDISADSIIILRQSDFGFFGLIVVKLRG